MPESADFRGVVFRFDLSFEPVSDGKFLRFGDANDGWDDAVLVNETGEFGLRVNPEGHWAFINSSLPQFLACLGAWERLYQRELTGQVEWRVRGAVLEEDLRAIDAAVLTDPNGPWAVFVEELSEGVV